MVQKSWVRREDGAGGRLIRQRNVFCPGALCFSCSLPFSFLNFSLALSSGPWLSRPPLVSLLKLPFLRLTLPLLTLWMWRFVLPSVFRWWPSTPSHWVILASQGAVSANNCYSEPHLCPSLSSWYPDIYWLLPTGCPLTMSRTKLIWAERYYSEMGEDEVTHPKGMCAQSGLTLGDPMDHSSPDSPVHGIFQTRILEWIAISSSRGSSQPRDWTHVSYVFCIHRQVL